MAETKEGTIRYKPKCTYTGTLQVSTEPVTTEEPEQKWLPEGEGVLQCEDGEKYVGSWKNGKFDGLGKYEMSMDKEGFKYVGSFKEDKFDGFGDWVFVSNRGWHCNYSGQWKENSRDGWGVQACISPIKFENESSLRSALASRKGSNYDFNVGWFKDNSLTGYGWFENNFVYKAGEF